MPRRTAVAEPLWAAWGGPSMLGQVHEFIYDSPGALSGGSSLAAPPAVAPCLPAIAFGLGVDPAAPGSAISRGGLMWFDTDGTLYPPRARRRGRAALETLSAARTRFGCRAYGRRMLELPRRGHGGRAAARRSHTHRSTATATRGGKRRRHRTASAIRAQSKHRHLRSRHAVAHLARAGRADDSAMES